MLEAQKLHASLVKTGFQNHVYRCNLLLNAYATSGALFDAQKLLTLMAHSNVVSCNTLLSAYVKSRRIDDALKLFSVTPETDSRSWNIIISGCAQNQRCKEAVNHFVGMCRHSVRPDSFTCAIIVPFCNLKSGQQVHPRIIKACSNADAFLGTNLVRMYAEEGEIGDAQRVFDEMPKRDSVSWNALISCYSKLGMGGVSLDLFRRFVRECGELDEYTFAIVLNELALRSWVFEAMQVHSLVIRYGFSSDRFINTALVNLYCKCSFIASAFCLFEENCEPDVVSWTTMIVGFAQNGWEKEAMHLFYRMQLLEVVPNSFTFGGLLGACASTSSFEKGRQYHGLVLKYGLESNPVVGSSIVDMYCKCGEMNDAFRLFQSMPEKDIVCWNGMICGFAQNGDGMKALGLFSHMVQSRQMGIVPNEITFIGVLSACSHCGLINEGRSFFNDMTHKYMIKPMIEHYTCMVDILARGGLLEEAEDLILALPFEPDSVIWGTLLGACKRHGDLTMASRVAEQLFMDEPDNSSSYVLLANMHTAICEWGGALDVREMMQEKEIKKLVGSSWIEIRNHLHSFVSGDQYHREIRLIHMVLQRLYAHMVVEGMTSGEITQYHEW